VLLVVWLVADGVIVVVRVGVLVVYAFIHVETSCFVFYLRFQSYQSLI
jgi:hypothetical protein